MGMHRDWDGVFDDDGSGYIVVQLHKSRLRQFLAWLRRRPTVEVYPVQRLDPEALDAWPPAEADHWVTTFDVGIPEDTQPPTAAEIEGGEDLHQYLRRGGCFMRRRGQGGG